MKRTVIALVMGLLVILWPLTTTAGETRIYISWSIGGAVIVGSGLLFFSLTYSSRVSQDEHDPKAIASWARSFEETPPPTQPIVANRLVEPLPVELPLFVFRW